jgi:hypothetical protein
MHVFKENEIYHADPVRVAEGNLEKCCGLCVQWNLC